MVSIPIETVGFSQLRHVEAAEIANAGIREFLGSG